MPAPEDEPVFAAPWEARVFALQQTLLDAGVFTPAEWAERLGAHIRTNRETDDGEGTAYYRAFLSALESLIADKGLAAPGALCALAADWQTAAARTPHGKPITLEGA